MGHGVVMMAVRLPARPSVCPTVRLVVVTSMDSHKRLREEKVKEEEEDVLPPPRKRPTFRRAIEMAKREDGVETVQEYFELFDSDDEEDEEKEDSEMNAIFRVAAGHGRDDTVKYLIGDNPGLVELDVKERNIGEEEEEEEEEEEKNGDDDDDNLTALEQAAKHAGAANVVELLLGHGGYSDAIKVSALQQAATQPCGGRNAACCGAVHERKDALEGVRCGNQERAAAQSPLGIPRATSACCGLPRNIVVVPLGGTAALRRLGILFDACGWLFFFVVSRILGLHPSCICEGGFPW